jgi:hypothetical protein
MGIDIKSSTSATVPVQPGPAAGPAAGVGPVKQIVMVAPKRKPEQRGRMGPYLAAHGGLGAGTAVASRRRAANQRAREASRTAGGPGSGGRRRGAGSGLLGRGRNRAGGGSRGGVFGRRRAGSRVPGSGARKRTTMGQTGPGSRRKSPLGRAAARAAAARKAMARKAQASRARAAGRRAAAGGRAAGGGRRGRMPGSGRRPGGNRSNRNRNSPKNRNNKNKKDKTGRGLFGRALDGVGSLWNRRKDRKKKDRKKGWGQDKPDTVKTPKPDKPKKPGPVDPPPPVPPPGGTDLPDGRTSSMTRTTPSVPARGAGSPTGGGGGRVSQAMDAVVEAARNPGIDVGLINSTNAYLGDLTAAGGKFAETLTSASRLIQEKLPAERALVEQLAAAAKLARQSQDLLDQVTKANRRRLAADYERTVDAPRANERGYDASRQEM